MITTFTRLALDRKLQVVRTLCNKKKNRNFFDVVETLKELNPIVSVWNNGQVVLKIEQENLLDLKLNLT